MKESRRCHRLRMKLPACFKFSSSDSEIALATVLDFSALGICISTKEKLEFGQEIVLEVFGEQKKKMQIKATVVWVKESNLIPKADYLIGLKVSEDMSLDEKKFLKFFSSHFISSS